MIVNYLMSKSHSIWTRVTQRLTRVRRTIQSIFMLIFKINLLQQKVWWELLDHDTTRYSLSDRNYFVYFLWIKGPWNDFPFNLQELHKLPLTKVVGVWLIIIILTTSNCWFEGPYKWFSCKDEFLLSRK